MVLKTIHQKEDGTYTADGTAWAAVDYELEDNKYWEIKYLYIIDGDTIREKELKRTDITMDVVGVFANEELS